MNATHPSKNNATVQESVSLIVSASRKLKSWEIRDFVTEYQTYTSPGSAAVASRLAARYNPELGYSYETQRQIAEATGFTRNAVARYLSEIEATGLWTIQHGQPGVASRYAPNAAELRKAKMFIEYRLAGKLSSFPYRKVPNFIRPAKNAGELKGLAKTSKEAKQARDIREAAEVATMEPQVVSTPVSVPAPEPDYEITAYSPDDMADIPFPDEPYFDEPVESDDPFLNRIIVDPTEQFPAVTAVTPTAQPVVLNHDDCPF